MPEIIKKGELPEEKVYEAVCSNCGTHFRFKRGEAKFQDDQRDGAFLSIRCPLPGCTRENYVSAKARTIYG